jgi:RIO kinase 1
VSEAYSCTSSEADAGSAKLSAVYEMGSNAAGFMSGLEDLLSEGVISEVLGRLKSGKEAEVYVVRYGGNVVAAKVYKDRAHRSFKNNADYKEGRAVRNTRSQRAMTRGSSFGKAATEDAWKAAEVDALYKLHAAGVRVPTPVIYLDGVLLMELVLGDDGEAAPRVIDFDLTPEQANAAYKDMLGQLVKILTCDLIHGDLSPYNVLWAATGPTIIDFPQIISASHNSRSEVFFLRDARNILGHFAQIDPSLHARSGDPQEIWRTYVRRELTPDYLPSGRAPMYVPRPRPVERGLERPTERPMDRRAPMAPRPQQAQPQQQRTQQQRPQHAARPAHGAPQGPGPRPQGQQHQGPRPQGPPQGGRPQGHPQRPQQQQRPPQQQRRTGPEVFVRRSGAPSAMPTQAAPPRDDRPANPHAGGSAEGGAGGGAGRRRRRRRH